MPPSGTTAAAGIASLPHVTLLSTATALSAGSAARYTHMKWTNGVGAREALANMVGQIGLVFGEFSCKCKSTGIREVWAHRKSSLFVWPHFADYTNRLRDFRARHNSSTSGPGSRAPLEAAEGQGMGDTSEHAWRCRFKDHRHLDARQDALTALPFARKLLVRPVPEE